MMKIILQILTPNKGTSSNLFNICLALLLFSCHSEIPNKQTTDNYFNITDVEIKNIVGSNIKNLDKKNGFKNIFLNSNFSTYKFNPNEWKITKENGGIIIEATSDLSSKKIYINDVQLKNIKLIFYDTSLFLIDINCFVQSTDQQNIFEVFKSIYGAPTHNLFYPEPFSTFNFNEYETDYKYEIISEPIKNIESNHNFLDSRESSSRSFTKDDITGEYYSSLNLNEYSKGWEGDDVRLKYFYSCNTKGYYGDDLENVSINTNPNYTKIESSERFIIISKEGLNKTLKFLKKNENQQNERLQKQMEEKRKKEIDKL